MMFKVHKITPHIDGVLVEKLNWLQMLCMWFAGQDRKTYRWTINPVTDEFKWIDGTPPRGWYNIYTRDGGEFVLKF